MQILKDHSIQYSSFDILSDEEVRQGLKTYSNWPTFPQVYVGGDLIGGLDIVKVRSPCLGLILFGSKIDYFNVCLFYDYYNLF